jgi:hypothetical protein
MSTGIKFRRLAAATVAAAVGAAMVVNIAAAQAPPNPPSRFVGAVTVNGVAAATGTVVEGRVGGATCGTTTVFQASGQGRYVLDVPAADPASAPGCGTDGATVTFFVGGQQAAQTGTWRNFQLNTLDLTAGGAATQPPATTTATPTTPAVTPRPPTTGNFDGSSSGSNMPMLEVLLVATAIGLGGVAIAARARRS